ncbi:MAG: site-specific integrase [Pseudomonadota bacterium]
MSSPDQLSVIDFESASVVPSTHMASDAAFAQPLVAASTDSELAQTFLYSHALSKHSLKSTKKDLGRFLLWCQSRSMTLARLQIEDLNAYKAFLIDPQPVDQWVSSTKWPRTDQRWRPFSGPLSAVSANHAFRVVKALLEFAKDAGYLTRNAGALVKNIKTVREARIARYLDVNAIGYVQATLDAMPANTLAAGKARARDRFLFLAYVTTGARLSEITGACMGAIYAEGDGRWWLDVLGKGDKKRRLPVSLPLLESFRQYRAQYGLPPQTLRDDTTPLVLATRGSVIAAVSDEAVSKTLKSLFARAAEMAENAGQADCAAALRNASAHWLRHTMLTTHANNDVSLKVLQDTAGHANISTTALYLHKSDRERHDALLGSLAWLAAESR